MPANLRVISVGTPQENVGLRKIGLRRSPTAPDTWDIFVAVHNYGARPHDTQLELQFAKSPAGSKLLHLQPGADEQATFSYRSKVAGDLEARLNVRDAFPQDDRAVIELPAEASLKVVVYSKEPQLLRPLIAANPQVEATFESPDKYDPAAKADVVVLDRFIPRAAPRANSVWIEPPASGSPVAVRETKNEVKLEKWRPDTPLGEGLRTQDVTLESAEVFAPAAGDITVAESAAGPLVVARATPSGSKLVVLGFHPGRASMKYQLATPLLMANVLRWMSPDTFRQWDVQAGTVGTVNVPVEKDTNPSSVHVLDENQRPLPFTISGDSLRVFRGSSGHGARSERRSRNGLLAHAAGRGGSGMEAAGECSPRHPANPRSRNLPRRICGRGWPPWAALGCCSTGCSIGRSRAVSDPPVEYCELA